jgi:hypothetical protein
MVDWFLLPFLPLMLEILFASVTTKSTEFKGKETQGKSVSSLLGEQKHKRPGI